MNDEIGCKSRQMEAIAEPEECSNDGRCILIMKITIAEVAGGLNEVCKNVVL